MIQETGPLTLKRWTIFTTYGWFIGILLVVGLALLGETLFKMTDESPGQSAVGIGMSAGVGLMQWRVLRNYVSFGPKWFWYTLIGFSLSFIAMDVIAANVDFKIQAETVLPIVIIAGALISGALQYYFIFKKIKSDSYIWILYSVFGWLTAEVATTSTMFINMKFKEDFPKVLILIFVLLFLSIGGPILGYITGRFVVPKINKSSSPE